MSWNYSDNEFIKIYRKMLSWEWYTDVNTKTLFLHCLLKANWKDGSWHGYTYKRGQFITSLTTLARETGLTVKQVRTALKHLERTGEVASWHDSKIRIITVISYDSFQGVGRPMGNQGAGKGQAKGKRGATDIRSIRSIRNKEDKKSAGAYDPLAGRRKRYDDL
jgi:hypothetical protein